MLSSIDIVLGILSICGIFSIVGFGLVVAFNPAAAWSFMHKEVPDARARRWFAYAVIVLQFGTLYFVFYHGIASLFAWMPASWGHATEDGFVTAGEGLAGILGLAFAGAALGGLTTLAEHRALAAESRASRPN